MASPDYITVRFHPVSPWYPTRHDHHRISTPSNSEICFRFFTPYPLGMPQAFRMCAYTDPSMPAKGSRDGSMVESN